MQSVQTEKDLTTALAIMGTQEMVSTAQVRIHIEIHLYEPCLTLIYKRESFLMTLILTYIVLFYNHSYRHRRMRGQSPQL